MYINSGYLHHSLQDFKDKSRPLVVGSCGTYRLIHQPKLPTYRPRGRIDYQLLYVASGKGYFFLIIKEIIEAGHMILYLPEKCRDMFTTVRIRQKFTGFTLQGTM